MARSGTCLMTVAGLCLLLNLILCINAAPSLTLVAEQLINPTTHFLSLSTKMIPLSGGNYRLCVAGVATTGSVPTFVTRDISVSGTVPTTTSENSPKLPTTYTTASDISAMDSSQNKCFYSVLHQESGSASSYAIVQADIGPPSTNAISLNTNILTVNASSTTQTYLLNSNTQAFTTAFTALSMSSITSVCGSPLSSTSVMYAVGRKSASVLIGFDGQSTSFDVGSIGYKVSCDALSTAQYIVCYDTQTSASTISCRTNQGINTQLLQDKPSLSVTYPSVAYLNSNAAAVVMQTNASIYQIVVVDVSVGEILRVQSEPISYGFVVADAMNNVLSVVFNNASGLWLRTYWFDQGLGTTPTVVSPVSSPTGAPSSAPLSTPSASPTSTPSSAPTYSPVAQPSSSPVASPTPSTAPQEGTPSAPVSAPTVVPVLVPSSTPSDAIGITPVDPNAAGADGKVLGPAIAIPLAAVGAGVFLLVFFLRKKKKKSQQKKDDDTLDGDASLTVINPAADPGRYSAIVSAAKDDGINPTAIQPSEIDKRMQIPYKSLRFVKEIGAGSYGKVFVGEWRGAQVAIKVNNTITDIDGFLGEAKLTLGITPHPNLVQTFGVSLDGPNPCIVLEFCGGGSLDNVVFDREKHVTDEQRRDYALKIAYGLLHLHNNNIIHRDLAARNILLTNDGQPKISDFGMSRIIQEESSQGKTKASFGPIRWMAPESLKDKSYSTKSDVWSYGILLYELVAGTEPHIDEDQLSIAVRIRDSAATPVIPSQCDPVLKQVMEMCWKPNPNDRPSMETISEFLRSHNS